MKRETLLFGSALLAVTVAVVADHRAHTSNQPEAAQPSAPTAERRYQDDDENYTPCGAR